MKAPESTERLPAMSTAKAAEIVSTALEAGTPAAESVEEARCVELDAAFSVLARETENPQLLYAEHRIASLKRRVSGLQQQHAQRLREFMTAYEVETRRTAELRALNLQLMRTLRTLKEQAALLEAGSPSKRVN